MLLQPLKRLKNEGIYNYRIIEIIEYIKYIALENGIREIKSYEENNNGHGGIYVIINDKREKLAEIKIEYNDCNIIYTDLFKSYEKNYQEFQKKLFFTDERQISKYPRNTCQSCGAYDYKISKDKSHYLCRYCGRREEFYVLPIVKYK